ncbi:hypothetical protein AK830_g4478 [Neonectria ditissima]|uniref:NAD(P)-binding domain-containing protein n=1 Tax=Neonectria ditissima TaxID=78410 RepID=A0A0N8H7L1_9HYPO|nr:hypothetical protein AK830_g4478 [Neonectria ditissima]
MDHLPTAIPRGSWVLVVAAGGYTGCHVVIELLERGFNVRGSVRELENGQWLLDDPSIKPFADQDRFRLVVADPSKPNAFDDVVRGVSAVIHIGVISDFLPDPTVSIPTAVESALTVCRSAAKEPSIKRLVFTTTFWAASMPIPGDTSTIDQDTWNDEIVKAAWAPPPYELSRALEVYFAGKTEAEKAVRKFAAENEVPWELILVSPCWIVGDLRHINNIRTVPLQIILQLFQGKTDGLEGTSAVYYSHVIDNAIVHVAAAIDPDVRASRIHVNARSFTSSNALAILREAYPNDDFPEDYITGDPKLEYHIENDVAPSLIQKWAGRDWLDLKQGFIETYEFMKKAGLVD